LPALPPSATDTGHYFAGDHYHDEAGPAGVRVYTPETMDRDFPPQAVSPAGGRAASLARRVASFTRASSGL
jgi:hypothetical protein